MGKALSLLALSLLMALSQISLFLSDALEKGNAGDRTESAACRIHVFAEEEMIREAGLVTEGILVRKCRNCGYSEKITIPELMQARTFQYTDGIRTITLPYRIFYPSSYERDTQEYPIVIYYHGAGEVGTDNTVHVRKNALMERLADMDNAILIAPQCREGCQWVNTPWSNGSYDSRSVRPSIYLDASIALLEEILCTERVDENRVYAVGISMGGYAAWNVVMEHPEMFAAVIPICGAADPGRAAEILDVAVWAFHGEKDRTVPVSGSREMVEAIRNLGGTKVRYTEYEGIGHNCWSNAFAEPELTDWLFAQQKTGE